MDEKRSGSYYTPFETVNFAYDYLLEQNKIFHTILEPSLGDGRFLDAFMNLSTVNRIVGVELYEEKIRNLEKKGYSRKITIINSDFLLFSKNCTQNFQLIIGNPPYINIKNMNKSFLDIGKTFCTYYELPENLLQNAWVAFVLASIKLLAKNGAVFFVLPTEFLQVNYAEKLRGFLEEKFNTIHILSFSERMFPEIQQEACLVYLTNEEKALPYILYRQYEKLDSEEYLLESRIERNKPLKKWSNAILSDCNIDLLNRTAQNYSYIGDIVESAPGIVTGANNKFILTEREVAQYDCKRFVIPIISKGVMARNKFEINDGLINRLAHDNHKVYLLNLAESSENELPNSLIKYLDAVAKTKRGEIEIQNSYKCSKRKPWYAVPIVKSGSVVFFKRYDVCPRMATNPSGIHTTDIAYNLQLHGGIEAESLVFCFYNSLTLAQCEFVGRYYAGGVSELTPNEFRSVSIPYRYIQPKDVLKLKEMFNEKETLETIIDFVDSKTIAQDLEANEVIQLDSIRKRLVKRRKQKHEKTDIET